MREHKRLRIIWGRRKQESDNRINKRERRRKHKDKKRNRDLHIKSYKCIKKRRNKF